MSSPENDRASFDPVISNNSIYKLGSERFREVITGFSNEQRFLSLNLHRILLGKSNLMIHAGTAGSFIWTMVFSFGPQDGLIQIGEGALILAGLAIGAAGVYMRSASIDGINKINQIMINQAEK